MAIADQLAGIVAGIPTTRPVEVRLPDATHEVLLRIPVGQEARELINDLMAASREGDDAVDRQLGVAHKWWEQLAGPLGQPAPSEQVERVLAAIGYEQAVRPIYAIAGLDGAGLEDDDVPT